MKILTFVTLLGGVFVVLSTSLQTPATPLAPVKYKVVQDNNLVGLFCPSLQNNSSSSLNTEHLEQSETTAKHCTSCLHGVYFTNELSERRCTYCSASEPGE